MKPTIILVHGAFAESASWDVVSDPLLKAGWEEIADHALSWATEQAAVWAARRRLTARA